MPDAPLLAHPVLADPDGRFAVGYNRASFAFDHGLGRHPLFDLPRLVELSSRLPAHSDYIYCSNGQVRVDDRWEARGQRIGVEDSIAGIAANDSLVMLKHVDQDVVLGPFLRPLLARVIDLCGAPMRSDVLVGRATLLIASPRRITAYHIDADTNFLFQLAGAKVLSVFDPERAVVSAEELERYHAGDFNGARFKPERQGEGRRYALAGGDGVHIPPTAPHWAQNGADVSVALSLNYDLKSMARQARICRANHRLRRLGVQPAPPGASPWRDRLKIAAETSLEALRRKVAEPHA